jgi:Cu(I)/Ag(I) efflux system membrane protein CusA/SilA
MRRGIAELNGEGEVAGGVVILRSGKNARETIAAVKDKLADLKKACRRASRWSRSMTARS